MAKRKKGLSRPSPSSESAALDAAENAAGAWGKMAAGHLPVPGNSARIEYFYPGKQGQLLEGEHLAITSLALEELLQCTQLDRETIGEVRAFAVTPGELLARAISPVVDQPGQDVSGREVRPPMEVGEDSIQAGPFVRLLENGEYRAERYGYMVLLQGQLSVVSPLWLDAEEMHVYWMVLDDESQAVNPEMIQQHLTDLGVTEGIQEEKIARLAGQIGAGTHRRGLFLVAAGQSPEDGLDARVELLVDTVRRTGTEREDGSIDFRDVNFTPNVTAEQLVARRTPPTSGLPGRDVKGRIRPAVDGKDHILRAGENVRVEMDGEVQLFYAATDGALRMSEDVLSVVKLLVINGDISFSTGNLDFGGEIYIRGSVVQGFSVNAREDITIDGTVEPGTLVASQKDVAVGRGIVGRRTKVSAGGRVHAQFVQEASVTAGKDIELGNFAYHAQLNAGGRVIIAKAGGRDRGRVMGGQIWARRGIETYIAGTPNGTPTSLVAGLGPEQAQELDRVERNIESTSAHIERILEQFGLERVHLDHIRNMIKAAIGPRRKLLAHRARQLGQLAQAHQRLLATRRELKEQLGASVDEVEIRIWDRAYPGAEIRISEYRRKLESEVRAARFHIEDGKLAER